MVSTRRFVEVGVHGGLLTVWCDGEVASARAVFLMLHDAAGNARVWDLVMDRLPPDVAVIAPDLRGRGASSDLGGPWGSEAMIDDLDRVLEHFGVDQVGVVGLGSSAALADALARSLPGVVAVTVSIEGDGAPDPFIEALDQGFGDRPSCHRYWRDHPVFAEPRSWNPAIEVFLDHGLGGTPPLVRPRADPAAVAADHADHAAAEPSEATRRIVVVPPHRIGSELTSASARSGATLVPATAPVAAVLSPRGSDAVARVMGSLLSSPGSP